jgi:hypothetical protein
MKTTTTKKAFKSWLESKKPGALVGISSNAESCPLAQYFCAINELEKGQVTIDCKVEISNKDGDILQKSEFTTWMNKFISAVDEWKSCDENKSGSDRISAKKALDFLG